MTTDPGNAGPPDGPVRSSPAGASPLHVAAIATLLVGVALVVVGAFLPWVWSGTSGRSSFAMARTADRLGVAHGGVAVVIVRAWYLVPLIGATALVLVSVHRRHAAAIVGVLLAAVVATIALVVVTAVPGAGAGPYVSLAGAVIVLVGALVVVVDHRRTRAAPGAIPTP